MEGDDCPVCDGRSTIGGKNCEACAGTGKRGPECEVCAGNGWVDDPDDGGTMSCEECDCNGFLPPTDAKG